MEKTLYACPTMDLEAEFFVGQKIEDQWHIRETAGSAYQAFKARNLIIAQDQSKGRILPEDHYLVFKNGLNNIIIKEIPA